jgi:hypothetical protein
VTTDTITKQKPEAISVTLSPSPKLTETTETTVEEMACAIAEAQAALFAGRFHDLECCATRLQDLCASLKKDDPTTKVLLAGEDAGPSVQFVARRVHQQNKVFAAVLRRMRRQLESLRGLAQGPSLTYEPKTAAFPERQG